MEFTCYNLTWYTAGIVTGFIWGFGVSTATLVTCTMISISAFLNVYYSVFLSILGGALIFKYHRKNRLVSMDTPNSLKQ